jgi:hypothetical protein
MLNCVYGVQMHWRAVSERWRWHLNVELCAMNTQADVDLTRAPMP